MPRRRSQFSGIVGGALQTAVQSNIREGSRKKRIENAIRLQEIMFDADASIESKRKAAFELRAIGFPVKVPEEPIDLKDLFTAYKVPENLQDDLTNLFQKGHLTGNKLVEEMIRVGGRPAKGEIGVDTIQRLKDIGAFPEGSKEASMSAQDLKLHIDYFGKLPDVLRKRQAGLIFGTETDKLTIIQQKQKVWSKNTNDADGKRRPLGDILKDKDAMGNLNAAGISPKRVMALYGVDTSMYVQGEKSIINEIGGGSGAWYAFLVQQFVSGAEMEPGQRKRLSKLLNSDGTLKPEVVVARMKKIQQTIIDQSELSNVQIDDVPAEVAPHLTFLLEQGFNTREQVRDYFEEARRELLPDKEYVRTKEMELQLLEYFPSAQ